MWLHLDRRLWQIRIPSIKTDNLVSATTPVSPQGPSESTLLETRSINSKEIEF